MGLVHAIWPCFIYQIKYLACLECSQGGGPSKTKTSERGVVRGLAWLGLRAAKLKATCKLCNDTSVSK